VDPDHERFRALYDECFGAIAAYARRRCDAEDAADAIAETFAIVWRRLGDVPRGRELPWCYGVARRVIANQRRARGRRERLGARLGAEWRSGSFVETMSDWDVRGALARLRESDREILRLAAWECLGASDIAVVLGCSPNAASIRLHKARRRLRAALTTSERPAPYRTPTSTEEPT